MCIRDRYIGHSNGSQGIFNIKQAVHGKVEHLIETVTSHTEGDLASIDVYKRQLSGFPHPDMS